MDSDNNHNGTASKRTHTEEVAAKIGETLDMAFKFLSAIRVSGDEVDIMAEARSKLRRAYQLAKEIAEDGR